MRQAKGVSKFVDAALQGQLVVKGRYDVTLHRYLSRQVGGIGTKGPGETQLETDRRLVRTRISKLKSRLLEIEKQNKMTKWRIQTFSKLLFSVLFWLIYK